MVDYWDTYLEARDEADAVKKLETFFTCFKETTDKSLKRVVAYDIGNMMYLGQGVPVNKELGKKMMQVSADLGYPQAMNLYAQALTHDGDMECITYFCMALNEGEMMAASNLNKLLIAFQNAGKTNLINAVEKGVAEVARMNREKLGDEKGKAHLVLALIGLYGLGNRCAITPEQGERYLEQAIEKGHPVAKFIDQDPSLKYPEEMPEQYGVGTSPSQGRLEPEDDWSGNTPARRRNTSQPSGRRKNKWVALILCVLFGGFGAHRFYEGKFVSAVLYLLTMGFMGIGSLIDIICILRKPNPYWVE